VEGRRSCNPNGETMGEKEKGKTFEESSKEGQRVEEDNLLDR